MNGQLGSPPVLDWVKRAICRFAARNLPRLTGAENLLLFKKEFFNRKFFRIFLSAVFLFEICTVKLFCEEYFEQSPHNKVLFVSIPKAGTHLLWKAIERITHIPISWIGLSNIERFYPERDLLSTGPITGIHLCPEADRVRKGFFDRYNKILIIRDPRDVMVSFMHHLINGNIWKGCPEFDYETFVSLSPDGQLRETLLFPGVCLSPKSCFSLAVEWMKDPTVLVCRFEDLVGERGGGSAEKQKETLRKLAEHLGYYLTQEEIAAVSEQLYGGTWTYRKGQIGAWKEAFSEENKELFKQILGQAVIDLGYATDNNW